MNGNDAILKFSYVYCQENKIQRNFSENEHNARYQRTHSTQAFDESVNFLTKQRNYISTLPYSLSQIAILRGDSWVFIAKKIPDYSSDLMKKSAKF